MKIELQYPFNTKWSRGYLVTNKEPRRNVILYNSNRDRTTVSYARYLMSVHLKRFLESDEQVDHIDHNKLNDSLDNLQVLSEFENRAKEVKRKGRQKALIKCPICGNKFSIRKGNSQAIPAYKGKICTCSRNCYITLMKAMPSLTRKQKDEISRTSLIHVYTEKE